VITENGETLAKVVGKYDQAESVFREAGRK